MIWVFQSFAGLFVDATVGQVVRALSGLSLPVERSLPGAPFQPPTVSLPAASRQPVEPEPTVTAPGPWRDQDLGGDDVKLVRYFIVSLRRCHERLLPGGADHVVVTESMTGESFAAWRIAAYLASGERKIRRDDRRSLRVTYEVLDRWPRQQKDGCKKGETEALREILGTLRGFSPGRLPGAGAGGGAAPEPPPAPSETVIVWDGTGTPSQVGARGSVTLTKRWNGTFHDVTLEGTLSIRSRSYGHVRHALPPGFLPAGTDPQAHTCTVQRHATLGDTTRLENYGGWGVHVRRGDFPAYEGRATLWFPERTSGEYFLRCTWQTHEGPRP